MKHPAFIAILAALLLAGCASEPALTAGRASLLPAIDEACLQTKAPAERIFTDADLEADEIYVSAVKLPKKGELFALVEDNESDDTLRSLRSKEAYIDRKARLLGY